MSATSSPTPARSCSRLARSGSSTATSGRARYTPSRSSSPRTPTPRTLRPPGVYGVVSLIFWALMIIVSIKYAGFIMRAHNRGDGGVMALTALIQRRRVGRTACCWWCSGIFGAGLFFGDGMITPAISVTSRRRGAEGRRRRACATSSCRSRSAILVGLFAIQRRGTGAVGWLFGPVILVWFTVIGVLGAREVVAHPGVLQGLSPTWGVRFMVDHGVAAFLTLGAVVLAVTGAEALYADRGHFGARPIRMTWFGIVFPAVVLSYLGQGALILATRTRSPTRSTCWCRAGPGSRWCSWRRSRRSSPRRRRSRARSRWSARRCSSASCPD